MKVRRALFSLFGALVLTGASLGAATSASASSNGCNGHVVTADYMGTICTYIDGTKLHTVDIGGTYNGNYTCSHLQLYINGKYVQSSPNFCAYGYDYRFPYGTNKNWPNNTHVEVCAQLNLVGWLCGYNLVIHS